MRFSGLTTLTTLLAAVATEARIESVQAPTTINPSEGFNFKLNGYNYIQRVYQVSGAIGWKPVNSNPNDNSLGTVLGSFYLGPEESNKVGDTVKWIGGFTGAPTGPVTLTCVVHSLYGAAALPAMETFKLNVTLGSTTSTTYTTGSIADSVSF